MANGNAHKTTALSCAGGYTNFDMGSRVIRFRTPLNLKRYMDVKQWDNGYIVVDAEYEGLSSTMEEHIDFVPILENLYLAPTAILSPIEEVRVA